MIDVKELHYMVVARYALIAVETYEEVRFIDFVHAMFGKDRLIFTWSATDGLVYERHKGEDDDLEHEHIEGCQDYFEVVNHIKKAAEADTKTKKIFVLKDWHPALDSGLARRAIRDLANILPLSSTTVLLVSPQFRIPSDLEKSVTLFEFPMPSEDEIVRMVKASATNNKSKLEGKKITEERTREVARACLGLTAYETDTVLAKSLVKHGDYIVREMSDEKKQIIKKSGILEIYDPDVALEELGGMEDLKGYLEQVKVQADDPSARAYGLSIPKGILLLSPPGNGKSALAKAIALHRNLPLVKFDFGAMMGSLVGESEANMRKAFNRIDSIKRCVVWMDEIEKAFPGKDSGGGDSGTSKRMLGMALTWMQESTGESYKVGTANSVWNLPPELLRAGRWDAMFFIDLPTLEQRLSILGIHLKKRGRDWRTSAEGVRTIAAATEGYSGAELEQVVVDGLQVAFYKKRGRDDVKLYDDILEASKKVAPLSVTMKEDIDKLRDWAKTRARMASKAVVQKKQLSTARSVGGD